MADANIQVKNQESKSNDNEKPSDEGLPGKEASAGVVSKRQVLSALKLKNPGILSTLLGLILLFPMKVLSMFGLYHLKKRELYLSGQRKSKNGVCVPEFTQRWESQMLLFVGEFGTFCGAELF